MKNVVYIILSFLLLTGFSGEKVVSSLQDRGGVKYEKNSEVPFTGVLVEKYENGQKKLEEHYKDGKLEGLWTWWSKNGQKVREGNTKDGELDGLWTTWGKDGNIIGTGMYKDGKLVQ